MVLSLRAPDARPRGLAMIRRSMLYDNLNPWTVATVFVSAVTGWRLLMDMTASNDLAPHFAAKMPIACPQQSGYHRCQTSVGVLCFGSQNFCW